MFRRYTVRYILVTQDMFIKKRRETTTRPPHRHPVRLVHAPSWLPEESNKLGILVLGAVMVPLRGSGIARLTLGVPLCFGVAFDCVTTAVLGSVGWHPTLQY